jgi:hypothetical protein
MDNSKIDLKKKAKLVEASPADVKTELSDEQLSEVAGGTGSSLLKHCAAGTHYKKVVL